MRGAKRCQTAHYDRALCISDSKHSPASSLILKQFTFLPWTKPHSAALFQQAKKQPWTKGLLQRPLPWPKLSQLARHKLLQAPVIYMSSVLNQPGEKRGCKTAGRAESPALHEHTWGYLKPHKAKAQIPRQVPHSLFLFQLLHQYKKWFSPSSH